MESVEFFEKAESKVPWGFGRNIPADEVKLAATKKEIPLCTNAPLRRVVPETFLGISQGLSPQSIL
jgi:hypothetical protein